MRAPVRHLLLLTALGLAAVGLVACGGSGGGPTGSTGISTAATGGSGATPRAGAGAEKAGKTSNPSATAGSAQSEAMRSGPAARRAAGRAAPFVQAGGDNSIPTYGSEAGGSEREAAAADLSAYLEARAKGDWSGACAHMAVTMRKQLQLLGGGGKGKAKSCGAVYKLLAGRGSASMRANPLSGGIVSLRVKEDRGFALFYGSHHQRYVMPMAREGGAWKVTQIAPMPYPLGSPTAR